MTAEGREWVTKAVAASYRIERGVGQKIGDGNSVALRRALEAVCSKVESKFEGRSKSLSRFRSKRYHGEEQRELFPQIESQLFGTRPFGWRRLPGLPSEARRAKPQKCRLEKFRPE